jgi:hypothetical protein
VRDVTLTNLIENLYAVQQPSGGTNYVSRFAPGYQFGLPTARRLAAALAGPIRRRSRSIKPATRSSPTIAGAVTEYAPPYTGSPSQTIAAINYDPSAVLTTMALDQIGDVFVVDTHLDAILEYGYYGNNPNVITTGVSSPTQLFLSPVPVSNGNCPIR